MAPRHEQEDAPEARQATPQELKERGWTESVLKEAAKLLESVANRGWFSLNIPRAASDQQGQLKVDLDDTVPAIVALPKKEQSRLKEIAAVVAAGGITIAAAGGVLSAGGAGAEEYREITTEAGTHTYNSGENVVSYKVTVNGKSADIKPAPGFSKVITTEGTGDAARKVYVYRALEPVPRPFTIDVPAGQSAEVIIETETQKTNAINITGGKGELQVHTTEGTPIPENLNGVLALETSLISTKTTKGADAREYSMPLTLQLLANRPDKTTGAALGLSVGAAITDNKMGKLSAQVGQARSIMQGFKVLPGQETVFLLSWDKPTGTFGAHDPLRTNAYFLSAYGASGKAEGGFTADLRVTDIPKSTADTEVFLGLGFSARGMTQTGSEHRILDFPRVVVQFPESQGAHMALVGALESDIDTGATAGRVGLEIRPSIAGQKKPSRAQEAPGLKPNPTKQTKE
ncbi:hypothetical protein HY623_04015 [Candidatus Uhrbacteria bacterium]|nr:hypothetical protein [Candidatus Uhrbacteria bacterium]